MRPFSALRDWFPEPLVAQLAQFPPETVCYCLCDVVQAEQTWFVQFIKTAYNQVQPIVDAEDVSAEFKLEMIIDKEAGGFAVEAEFIAQEAEPPFACGVRSEFPWTDPEALRCFLTLMQQPVWPFIFVAVDSEHILTYRAYGNPMTQADREACLKLIDAHVES